MTRTNVALTLACTLALNLGCDLGEEQPDSDEPTAIAHTTLAEMFPECAADIEACLDDPAIQDEIAQLIEEGLLSEEDTDALAAAGSKFTIFWGACRFVTFARSRLRKRCSQLRARPGRVSHGAICGPRAQGGTIDRRRSHRITCHR